MQILLSFLIGYFVGAKAGAEQFDEVVASARAVAESDEFHSLLQSLRAHAAATLHSLGISSTRPRRPSRATASWPGCGG